VLSTDKLHVVISKEGRITSIVDRELDRELILPNKNAGFVIFQDT
jgi:alpha-mannosidase